MNSRAQSEASKTLRAFAVHVEYWDPDGGDAFLMLNAREWLAAHPGSLSADEQALLARVDKQLLALAAAAVGDTPDVQFLQLTAKVAASCRSG